jgi:cullin 3
VLLLYNNMDSMKMVQMSSHLHLPPSDLVRAVFSLITSKILLVTTGGSSSATTTNLTEADLAPSTEISLNQSFSHKLIKLKISTLVSTETKEENTATHASVDQDRMISIQAAIVRVMKSRKMLHHNALLAEVVRLLSSLFSPSFASIKLNIEKLIEKEYLKRDEKDSAIYHYLS